MTDQSNQATKWYINEDGEVYDLDAGFDQASTFPNDDHVAYDSRESAEAARDDADAHAPGFEVPVPTSNAPRLTVVPGDVRVSSIDLIVDHDDAVVYDIDCSTKRASAGIHDDFAFLDPGNSLDADIEIGKYLTVGEHTLRPSLSDTDPERGPTPTRFFITVPEEDQHRWHCMIEGGRYSWRLVFFRDSRPTSDEQG